MIKSIGELSPAQKLWGIVAASGISLSTVTVGVAWAVDARIEQKTAAQIQQLRTDIVQDFEKNRIDYLQMKKNASIIDDDERIELDYLKEKQE